MGCCGLMFNRLMDAFGGPDEEDDAPAAPAPPQPAPPRPAAAAPRTFNDRMRELRREMREEGILPPQHQPPDWAGVHQAPVTPRAPGLRMRIGPADNRMVFDQIGAAAGGLHPSMLRLLDVPPFDRDVMGGYALDVDGMVVAYMLCVLRVPRGPAQRQQLMLEVLVPDVPEDLILGQQAAANIVQQCLLNYNGFRDCGWLRDLLGQAAAAIPANAQDRDAHWTRHFHLEPFGWDPAAQLADQLDYLLQLARLADDRVRARAIGTVLTMLASFALRGAITHSKLGKVVADLLPIIPYAADALNQADIALTWNNFGHLVDDRNMPRIMRRWLRQVPTAAIRLRVLLAQAAGSGLTSLDVIARAVHAHPEFPWPLIRRLYPEEWEAAGRALGLVGNNPYFGYRRDLAHVRSVLFKRLSSFCGKLLIACGDRTLENYRGFVEDRINRDALQRLIDGYLATHAGPDMEADITEDEMEAYRYMRDLARRSPVNMEGLANMDGHPDPDMGFGDGGDFRGFGRAPAPRVIVAPPPDDNNADEAEGAQGGQGDDQV
nr:MAG: S protein [Salarius guttatus piscichuvirus]